MPLNLNLLYEEDSRRSMTQVFYGLNKNLRSGEEEFFDMKNLTSDHAPLLAVRERRYLPNLTEATEKPTCLVGGIGILKAYGEIGVAWIEGTVLHIGSGDQGTIDLQNYGFDTNIKKRSIVKMGAYLIIVPDMIYVNTITVGTPNVELGKIEDKFEDKDVSVRLMVSNNNGDYVEYQGESVPQDAGNGDLWLDTREKDRPLLKQYDKEKNYWYEVDSYITITFANNDETEIKEIVTKSKLRAGDPIIITGVDPSVDGRRMIVKVYEAHNTVNAVQSIVIKGIRESASATVKRTQVQIERIIPKSDYVCEAGNRLWGCRYGQDGHGSFVNEVYCSARGDFYRWIQGLATDDDAPLTFSIGTDGSWTGCINYGGYPTFFKENSMHRVIGYGASGFSIQETPLIGVQPEADKSLAVVNNVLYYKSVSGIMAYDGSVPINVSDKLGRLSRYNNAVGGACGEKYYISMWRTDDEGNTHDPVLYVLDTEKGLWHKEDEIECESMASDEDNLYFVEIGRRGASVTHTIKAVRIPDDVNASEYGENTMIPWYAETGIIGLESPDAKYVSRLAIRMHLEAGATVRVLVQYDSSGYWKQIAGTEAPTVRTVTMPVVPARCDHMRLRLEGVGGCKVYSITKTVENAEEA